MGCLEESSTGDSILQKVRLRQKCYSCKFQYNGNMLEHIGYLKRLHDQLHEMGIEINDKELATTLLASLPDDFMLLITALDAIRETNVSCDKVKVMSLSDPERKSENVEWKMCLLTYTYYIDVILVNSHECNFFLAISYETTIGLSENSCSSIQ